MDTSASNKMSTPNESPNPSSQHLMISDPKLYQAAAVKVALRLYARTKIKVNRMYTPTNMLRTASKITGKEYKRNELIKAADDLELWMEQYKND
jgi:hypothetical protein